MNHSKTTHPRRIFRKINKTLKKYPQETQNMPDGTIGFQHINEKWFKKLEGHKLSLVKAKNNVSRNGVTMKTKRGKFICNEIKSVI